MRKEESGYGPASPVTDHPVRPRATRQPGVRPVRGETDHREPSYPHGDTPSVAVGDNARERSRVPGRRGRTLILFSIVTPFLVLTMSVVVAIAINKCPYSEEILSPGRHVHLVVHGWPPLVRGRARNDQEERRER